MTKKNNILKIVDAGHDIFIIFSEETESQTCPGSHRLLVELEISTFPSLLSNNL